MLPVNVLDIDRDRQMIPRKRVDASHDGIDMGFDTGVGRDG
jgi:hypothetical protein